MATRKERREKMRSFNLHFDRLTKEQEMDPAVKEYDIPSLDLEKLKPKVLNCVHIRNGKLKFGYSKNMDSPFCRSKNGGHFWMIPSNGGGAKKIRLPDLRKGLGGWYYGKKIELVF
jgi:hypothetical protein